MAKASQVVTKVGSSAVVLELNKEAVASSGVIPLIVFSKSSLILGQSLVILALRFSNDPAFSAPIV